MESDFRALLEEYAHKHGIVPIHLSQTWNGGGAGGSRVTRFFLVEDILIFDVKNWAFVGWVRPGLHAFPQTLQGLPVEVRNMVSARGWQDLLMEHNSIDLLSIIQRSRNQNKEGSGCFFPLCNEERALAQNPLDWVYLMERQCWINRDLERCACSVCYPKGLRDINDYSTIQIKLGHCVYCTCTKCRCELNMDRNTISSTTTNTPTPPLPSPCDCFICTLVHERVGVESTQKAP